jgi:succinate dehydrogenase / fumarate reductase membrane anchor subunit
MSGTHTPLKGAPGSGSQRRGTRLFMVQRATAIALLLLAFAYIVLLVTLPGADYATIRDCIANPLIAVSLLVFVLAGVWHMYVGMQVIIEDYLHSRNAKSTAIAIASVVAVVKIGLGL